MMTPQNEAAVRVLSTEAQYERLQVAAANGRPVAVALGQAKARLIKARKAFEATK